MSSAGISFGGLASGLDTKSIISALMAVEQRPITLLETKKTTLTKSKSLFGDLKGLLDTLQDKAKSLKTTNDFLQMKVSSDDETLLTASAASTASPGTHTINVVHLAKAQIHASSGSSSSSTANGSGGFNIDVGGNSLVIEPTDTSLDGIAAEINNQADVVGAKIRAEVVDTGGAAATRYQLVLRSTDTGVANAFTISGISGDTSFTDVVNSLDTGVKSAAQDAEVKVNGISVYRPTNSVSGAIAGVTLDLKAENAGKDVTITVATDATETGKKVQAFVDAYNAVVDFFNTQNALDADGKAKSPIFGDPTLRSIRSSLRSVTGSSVTTTGNVAYQLFSQVGITADTQGKLTFTQSKLEEALSTDENAVAAVFTDPTNGIATKLASQIDLYTDSVDGLLKTRNDGFDRQVKQTQDQIDQGNKRLEVYQKQLEAKYANLESLLSKLQSQGSSLSSIK